MGEQINLYYFGARGRGDMIKILLEDTQTPYQFHLVNDWPNKKDDPNFTPFGQLPTFHQGGFALSQSNSILRHVARLSGRGGSTLQESALMDMVLDSAEDLRQGYGRVIYGDYDGLVGGFVAKLPDSLRYYENFLNQHNVEYFGFNNFSYPDASLFCVIDCIKIKMAPNCLERFPALDAWYKRVVARPQISSYINSDKRPSRVNGNEKV